MDNQVNDAAFPEFISAGFLLVKPVTRPEGLSTELLPEQIVSASRCICPQFPGSYALSWCSDSTEARAAEFDRIGLTSDARQDASQWATAEFEQSFGWPGVFYTLDAALDARWRFFRNGNLVVLALGLPLRYRDAFVGQATPQPPAPAFAPQGRSGYLDVIEENGAVPPSAVVLGYEPVNVMFSQMDHSWLCNRLERYAAENLGIKPNATGLIDSLSDAARCCEAIARGDVGAEPGPWFPWLLAQAEE
jgi:hypothetical protein